MVPQQDLSSQFRAPFLMINTASNNSPHECARLEPDWSRTTPAGVPSAPEDAERFDASHIEIVPGRDHAGPANIADQYRDLLALVSKRKRLGMIAQLSVGFYEGWRPSRAEVADLIAVDLGLMTVDEAEDRVRQRR